MTGRETQECEHDWRDIDGRWLCIECKAEKPYASDAAWNSYWLIERPVEGRAHPEYWVAAALAPVGEWTDDPWKATRYATQEDAERALRPRGGFALPGTARAVSHGFEEPA